MSFGSLVLGKTIMELELDRSGYDKGVSAVERDAPKKGKTLGSKIGKGLGDALPLAAGLGIAGLATTVTVGIGGAFAGAISLTKDFEHGISAVGAVSGATKGQLDQIRDTALRLGKDTQFGASEAVGAMEILASNGVTTTDIINGAADAAVNLAAAGGTDLATAADTASTAMAVWGLKTSDMTELVNRMAGAANVSKFGVDDLSLAIAQGGGAASAAGVEYDDFLTSIAAISPLFSSGADAGTSFKTFVTRLSPSTKEATAAMKELGIITADGSNQFYDAQGNLKDMADITGILNEATKGLSEEQKIQAFNTIFGSDAMRTAIGLSKLSREEFEAMDTTMENSDAAEIAKGRTDNLAGAWENFTGAIESAQLAYSDKLDPMLKEIVSWGAEQIPKVTAGIDGFVSGVASGFQRLDQAGVQTTAADIGGGIRTIVDNAIKFKDIVWPNFKSLFGWFADHPGVLQGAAVAWAAFTLTTSTFAAIKGVQSAFSAIVLGIKSVNLTLLSPPGIALLFAGIATAIFLVWQHWDEIWPKLSAGWDAMKQAAGQVKDAVVGFFIETWEGLERVGTDIGNFFSTKWGDIETKTADTWSAITDTVSDQAADLKSNVMARIDETRSWLDRSWDAQKSKASDSWTWIRSTTVRLADATNAGISNAIDDARRRLDRTWDGITTKASDAWLGIKRRIDDLNPSIASAIKWPFEHARDAIGGIMWSFKNALAAPFNAAATGITDFIYGVARAVNWVGQQLHAGTLISFGGFLNVPHFERGGIAPGGPIIAGEHGKAELLMPPAGTRVFNARETVDIFKAVNNGQHPEGVPLGPNGPLGLGAGPFAGAINAVKSLAGSAADAVRGVLDKGVGWLIDSALGGLSLNTGGGAIGNLGGGILTHVMSMAKDAITEIFNAVKQALPDSVPNGNAILDMAYKTPGRYMWCEKFVGDVMDRMGLRYHRAASAAQHAGMQPLNPGTGPAGAVVFLPWDTYGHVAFSLGDGRIYGTANTPSGKGVMNAWSGAGWTATPFAKGGIVTGPVNAVVGEAGHEAIIPLDQLPEVIAGGLTPAFTALFKPTGKAGQALGEVNDAVVETKAAVDKSARDNVDWLAGIYNLEGINQNVTKDGFAAVDQAVSDGNKSSKTTLGQILDILRDSSTGSRPLYVTQTGGGSVSDQLSGALDTPNSDVITGGLTPGMAGMLPGGANNPIVLKPTGDVVTGGLPPGMNALFGAGSVNNGDVILGSGPVGGEVHNPDVITGSWTGFATGGLVRGRHPLLGMIGEGIHDEIISPVPILRDLLKEALVWASERGRTISDGLTITVNLNGEMHVNSRQDLDRLGRDVAASVVAGMRRAGIA